jgi:predicted transcriptional regulator
MTKLLDHALEAVRVLPPDEQDDIARVILQLAGRENTAPATLSSEERAAIDQSKAAAGRGEFATEDEVRTVWAKHGL